MPSPRANVVVSHFGLDPASVPRRPLYVVLDNIRSAYNVGSIFRTCDAAAAQMIYCCGITAHPPHHKLKKTSLGADFFVPWRHTDSALDAVRELQQQGVDVLALEVTERSENLFDVPVTAPAALVLGNEVEGVDPRVLDAADRVVAIPMAGFKNSLNVAVAAGIAVFEIVRRFRGGI